MRHSFEERLPTLDVLHTPEEDIAFVRDDLFSRSEMWGAFGPDLVGFIAFGGEWIEQLYVLPGWQGQGLGRQLLEIPLARYERLKLWTFQRNTSSRRFYERNGFIPIELTDGRDNEHKEPDVLYEWVRNKSKG